MKLSVLIPTYVGKGLLEKLIPELQQALHSVPESEIIVYDNNSKDAIGAHILVTFPTVKVIAGLRNVGFTGAINGMAKQARGEYLLFLNDDCFISTKSLNILLDFLDAHPDITAVQPVVKKPSGEVENCGFVVDIHIAKAYPVTDSTDARIGKNGWLYGLSATCLLIRNKEFVELGMFDAAFHSYLEDVDLAFRIHKAGKKVRCLENAECIHQHMTTSSTMGSYKQQRDLLNWIRVIVKNYSAKDILKYSLPLGIERLRNLNGLLKKLVQ